VTDESPSLQPVTSWQEAVVTDIITRTPRIKSFFFSLSRPFVFTAGQHVNIRLTAPDGYRAMRSYSIASAPEDATRVEVAIELLDNGEVSQFFHEVVAVGDKIDVRGPLGGYFIWSPSDGGPLLLIGGGSGVVPLMAMIRQRHAVASHVPVVLLFSARTWENVLYRDELLKLHERHDGFTLALTLTREHPMRATDYGRRIDAAMLHDVVAQLSGAPKQAFICGSNQFVDSAADATVAAGILSSNIRTERYGV
jgi:ferredoxin-NADP reductase